MPLNTTPTLLEAKHKIEAYCAYQERCEKEVRDKLCQWGIVGKQADIIIANLISNQFLNEERFAEAFVSGKVNIKRWGRLKIIQHLKQKQISKFSVDKAIKKIDDRQYSENLKYLFDKKCKALKTKPPLSWSNKHKIHRFLSSKGYESHLIFEVVETKL